MGHERHARSVRGPTWLFVDWDTGQGFWGKLITNPEKGPEPVLEFFRERHCEDGFIVDVRRRTGSIAILEASDAEILSLQNAGYRLSFDGSAPP